MKRRISPEQQPVSVMSVSKSVFLGTFVAAMLALAGAAQANPADPRIAWQDVVADASCDYCGDYRYDAANDVATSWNATWGYELARKIEPMVFVPETGCAYCGEYRDAEAPTHVASTWQPGSGYEPAARVRTRTARAGWWFW